MSANIDTSEENSESHTEIIKKQTARSDGTVSMTTAQTDETTEQKPLRLWPGVLAVVLQWLAGFVLPSVIPEARLG